MKDGRRGSWGPASRLAGGLVFACAILVTCIAACTRSESPGACPDTLAAAEGSGCPVAGQACCYGASNCSCDNNVFSCTDNTNCPAQAPRNFDACTGFSLCLYPSTDCFCDSSSWHCNSEPAGSLRSCLPGLPDASSAIDVPCGQPDPSLAPFLCRNAAEPGGCCPKGDLYSYLGSLCVGTWCPSGQICQDFSCYPADGGRPDSFAETGSNAEGSNAVDGSPAAVPSDSAPTDSTAPDRASPRASDAEITDSAVDAMSDSSTDSGEEEAATPSDSSAEDRQAPR
jgi:hypothetical protein